MYENRRMDFVDAIPGIPSMNRQSGVIAQFFSAQRIDPNATAAAGHPVYKTVEMVTLTIAGEVQQNIVKKVTDEIRDTYKGAYEAWKRGQEEQFVEGMPLSEWPGISRSEVELLRFFRVYSVEQLSELSDSIVQRIGMGGTALRAKAQDWLRVSRETAAAVSLARDLRRAEEEKAHATAQIQEMELRMQQMQATINTMLNNAGRAVPTHDQMTEISMIGQPQGVDPPDDVQAYLMKQSGLPVPAPAAPVSFPKPAKKPGPLRAEETPPPALPRNSAPIQVTE
jgi:hypothetical protein